MIDPLSLSIGAGLVVGLLLSEVFGVVAGGMVAPGYLALHLDQPLRVAVTLAAAFATHLIVEGVSLVTILYGKRRTALTILVGYLVGAGVNALALHMATPLPATLEAAVIGHIVPGLIAIWIGRQGFVQTCAALLLAAAVVRLGLAAVFPQGISP